MQLEAAWALTNVSAGSCEETRVVIENGALPLLINFTTRSNVDLKEQVCVLDPVQERSSHRCCLQALWAIGNIAAERSFLKALVEKGALDRVLHVLEMDRGDLRLERISIWALANFCRYGSEAIGLASVILLLVCEWFRRLSVHLGLHHSHLHAALHTDEARRSSSSQRCCMGHRIVHDGRVEPAPNERDLGTAWRLEAPDRCTHVRTALDLSWIAQELTLPLVSSYTERQTLHYPVSKACAQLLSGPESYALEFVSTDGLLPKLKKLVGSHINKKTMSNILWTLQNITANRYRVVCPYPP